MKIVIKNFTQFETVTNFIILFIVVKITKNVITKANFFHGTRTRSIVLNFMSCRVDILFKIFRGIVLLFMKRKLKKRENQK